MKGTSGNKPPNVERNKRTNGNIFKQMGVAKRLKISSLNSHLVCVLCSGYYVEATAIVECLHTFCRSCIVKYLQTNNFCPICDVQTHEAKPWSSLRSDKTLQDLVYKLVPGMYQDEMKRRRQFYSRLGGQIDVGEGEEGGFLPHGARFFSQDDSISLSLEYYSGQEGEEGKDLPNKKSKQTNEKPKRYLQCPAAVTVRHLKKFLRMKYGIGLDCWVDIIYNDECLPENFSLIDVAYTFAWKRTSPMRFAYRIFSKAAIRGVKSQKNYQISRMNDGEGKKSKHDPALEQQMQSEYLENFNLNPTSSEFCKTETQTKSKSNTAAAAVTTTNTTTTTTTNNNNNSSKNNNTVNNDSKTKKANSVVNEKKNDNYFKDFQDPVEGFREKTFQSSEDSDASGLRIMSEKEESLKENSEDSRESIFLDEKKRKLDTSVPNFEEEAVDSFTAKKLLKNKHKLEEKKRKLEQGHGEKRRKSASQVDEHEGIKKKSQMGGKRRRTIAEELSLRQENEERVFESLSAPKEDEELANLKNEALKKVFVTKDKPEIVTKRPEEEVRKKKRKKSKHHEGEVKKKKLTLISTSPSIMRFAKDPLKLKVKLTPSKTVLRPENETNGSKESEVESDKTEEKSVDNDSKKIIPDKERLLHLRAVRHKNIITKNNPKEYINAPPSLTISKVDSSEPQTVKNSLVETKPSLEIMLVGPTNNSKTKQEKTTAEPRREPEQKKVQNPPTEPRRPEFVDNFGVLDLSEKSTRTKETTSSSPPTKDISDTVVEKCRKSTHQSILEIAQNLVNRKLSPVLPKNNVKTGGFDVATDSSVAAAAAAMRNLKTLSDTAVNILMAAQNKSFATETQKRPVSSSASPPAPASTPAPKPITPPNSTKPSKDCENGSGLKIPIYPISRDRMHPIPPVPNLHELYPRGRGRPVPINRPSTPIIKPGQNQTVRQIPNPFVVLNRQGNQNQNPVKPPSPQLKTDNSNDETNFKSKLNFLPPLQNIKTKLTLPKIEDVAKETEKIPTDLRSLLAAKPINNNTKTVQNGSECDLFGLKNGEENKATVKLNNNGNPVRKIENMSKNIESVAAGLTARAVSNALIDAK